MAEMRIADLKSGMIYDTPDWVPPGSLEGVNWRLLFKPESGSFLLDGETVINNDWGNKWYVHQIGKNIIHLACFDLIWNNDTCYHFREPQEHEKPKAEQHQAQEHASNAKPSAGHHDEALSSEAKGAS